MGGGAYLLHILGLLNPPRLATWGLYAPKGLIPTVRSVAHASLTVPLAMTASALRGLFHDGSFVLFQVESVLITVLDQALIPILCVSAHYPTPL